MPKSAPAFGTDSGRGIGAREGVRAPNAGLRHKFEQCRSAGKRIIEFVLGPKTPRLSTKKELAQGESATKVEDRTGHARDTGSRWHLLSTAHRPADRRSRGRGGFRSRGKATGLVQSLRNGEHQRDALPRAGLPERAQASGPQCFVRPSKQHLIAKC